MLTTNHFELLSCGVFIVFMMVAIPNEARLYPPMFNRLFLQRRSRHETAVLPPLMEFNQHDTSHTNPLPIHNPAVEISKWKEQQQEHETCPQYQSTSINSFFACFRPFHEMQRLLNDIVRSSHGEFSVVNIGQTVEKHDIMGYKLSKTKHPLNRVLYIQAGLHAREWASISSLLYVMVQCMENHYPFLNKLDIIFVPLVNIDGYIYTWSTNRMWRKNRQVETTTKGVDLNRNFGPARYFTPGNDPASEDFAGLHAESEPETKSVEQFLTSIDRSLLGTLDVHTFAGKIVRPLSNSNSLQVPAWYEQKMASISEAMLSAMNKVLTSTGGAESLYTSARGNTLYGENQYYSGTFKDMVCLEHQYRPSLTIELQGNGFIVPANTIEKSGKELLAAVTIFADKIA